jgi:hypothetical protein
MILRDKVLIRVVLHNLSEQLDLCCKAVIGFTQLGIGRTLPILVLHHNTSSPPNSQKLIEFTISYEANNDMRTLKSSQSSGSSSLTNFNVDMSDFKNWLKSMQFPFY